MLHNCLIAQSGGPTAAINASLSGVITAALNNDDIETIYGALNGIQGVLDDNIIELNEIFNLDSPNLEMLKYTPAMFLGSCRVKLDKSNEQFKQIFDLLLKYDIGYFFYIGGNDSMDTVLKLSEYAEQNDIPIKILGIPKTIDNDLNGTDHTPGFGSAAKFVSTTMLEIAHDTYIYDTKSVTIVEIMGRNAGWLAASSVLARNKYNASPDLIYLPEVEFSCDNFLKDIENLFTQKKNIIIAVSEGIRDANGDYISSTKASSDLFGHSQLGGTAKVLENMVQEAFGCKVRSIELNVLQRSAIHSASLTDINEAFELGNKAISFALEGITGRMLTIKRISDHPYETQITTADIAEVANKEKIIPREWINTQGNDVTTEMVNYLTPLVEGQPEIKYEKGLPKFININHLISA